MSENDGPPARHGGKAVRRRLRQKSAGRSRNVANGRSRLDAMERPDLAHCSRGFRPGYARARISARHAAPIFRTMLDLGWLRRRGPGRSFGTADITPVTKAKRPPSRGTATRWLLKGRRRTPHARHYRHHRRACQAGRRWWRWSIKTLRRTRPQSGDGAARRCDIRLRTKRADV